MIKIARLVPFLLALAAAPACADSKASKPEASLPAKASEIDTLKTEALASRVALLESAERELVAKWEAVQSQKKEALAERDAHVATMQARYQMAPADKLDRSGAIMRAPAPPAPTATAKK